MPEPLVSIVVNNFNYGRFVGQAIASALEQVYDPIEVLVVDDGSTDESRQVVSGFGDRIQPIFKANEGQASAFNTGLEAARGDVLIYLDADDFLLPDAASLAVRALEERGVVKAHWPMWEVDETGTSMGRYHKKALIDGDYRAQFIARGPLPVSQSPTSGNAWQRWFLEKVMPLPEHEDRHGADGFLKKLCPIFGIIRRIDTPLSCYRVHAENSGARGSFFEFRRSLRRYPTYCRLLEDHLRQMGVDADSTAWMGPGSPFEWQTMAVELFDEIGALVPRGAAVVLIDNDAFGSELLPHRNVRPLNASDESSWAAPPESENQARGDLDQAIAAGADYLAIVFPAFWWRESYPRFFRHLESSFECLCRDERLILFALASGGAGDRGGR